MHIDRWRSLTRLNLN